MVRGAYGDRLGRSFHMTDPPTLVSHTAGGSRLAVTELCCDEPDYGFTAPIAREDAFLVGLQLRGLQRHELWVDGRAVRVHPIIEGSTNFFDLRRDPVAYIPEPFHPLFFYIPQAAFSELAGEAGASNATLVCRHGEVVEDEVLHALGCSLLPALHARQQSNALFVDHVLLALRVHLVRNYGGVRPRAPPASRGLAPWQERRAKELMRAHLADGIALTDLAAACALSPSAFVHAFKRSTGFSPHQWLIQRRVELATERMADAAACLADIALECGFADQSHFTRAFMARMGVSPGTWRRNMLNL
ncbi:MAG TPA: AraC family transcriptional regulator [Frateuria sp.]|uniref:helix-turn-helix domain-containing protein n=1 Tax=Frateuria sp. TaxID=2211372 RepID=UPI002D7FD13D|nr:AraC family transcriptional regulator [Frateuria sp.]HET6804118.1 AraC family transcriptional regulator [Frateuria sp.]